MSEGALKKSLASAETKASIASDLAKTLKNQLEAKESELGTLVEARDVLREESRRLKEEVASLTGAVAERNSAMSELAELRTELADAKRALESSSFADSSLSDVEHARDKAESELLAMAQRVATLEQQVLESQRAEDDALEKIDHNIVTSSKNDREEIDRLKTRIAELEVINAEAERSMSKLIAARAALNDAETSVKTYEIDKAEMKSQLESAEIRIMNANALASASKNALEEYKRHTEESSRIAQTALIAERDAAKIAADAAEKDRDAWSVKCTEARETLESWREKARKMLADKDRELDAIRGSASPIRSKRQLFSDDEDEENEGDARHTEEGDASRARARALSSLPEGALDESLVVYLRNVVKQFLLTPYDAHDRADALVPVITTILRFALEDEFRIKAHRASQRLKSQRAWPM
jgi:chromosome segregation ATPase